MTIFIITWGYSTWGDLLNKGNSLSLLRLDLQLFSSHYLDYMNKKTTWERCLQVYIGQIVNEQ